MNAAKRAMLNHRAKLMAFRNVVGCGVALKEVGGKKTNEFCVVVLVERKMPISALAVSDVIPKQVDDVPTDVVEVGKIRLLSSRTAYSRPAHPGCSVGHYRVSAGTFGAVVYDEDSGEPLILSNNHVLANATNGYDGRSAIGDAVYQPGVYDGGTAKEIIGHLTRYVPIFPNSDSGGYLQRPSARGPRSQSPSGNLIDAAVAKPIEADMINPNIIGIGMVSETAQVALGSQVEKSGRTSGLTGGIIRAVGVTVQVYLDEARVATFVDQIVSSAMSNPGDSGSLGVTSDGKAFGLLYAGSEVATIFNKIDHVTQLLRVRIKP